MGWRAVVPIKTAADRKTRLASRLSPGQRVALSDALLRHVLDALEAVEGIDEIQLLSPAPLPQWSGAWTADLGRGLNAELQALAVAASGPLLVVHADLPLLAPEDLRVLTGAGYGVALAADRHGRGTNAVALRCPRDFVFQFGPASLQRHGDRPGEAVAVVSRQGLAMDIDTPDDLDAARDALRHSGPDTAVRRLVTTIGRPARL